LKLKKDYVTGIGDSLDLVPLGAWYGNGRKVKWWSPILMGLYDQKTGRCVAVCKCMSGKFTVSIWILSRIYSVVCRFYGQVLPGLFKAPLTGHLFSQAWKGIQGEVLADRRRRNSVLLATTVGM
jgi:hypothetical protein